MQETLAPSNEIKTVLADKVVEAVLLLYESVKQRKIKEFLQKMKDEGKEYGKQRI